MEIIMETQNDFRENELREMAVRKVRKIKNFYGHLFVYSIALTVYVFKEYFGSSLNFPPINYLNWLIMSIWSFIIVVKAIKLFFAEIIFGNKWEENKIKEMMNQKTESKKWE